MKKSSSVDKAATDPTMLTVPGRRAESKLRTREGSNDSEDDKEIVVPQTNVTSPVVSLVEKKETAPGDKKDGKNAAPKIGSMVDQRMKDFQAASTGPKPSNSKPQELNVRKLIEYSPDPADKPCIINVPSPRYEPTVPSVENIKAQFTAAAQKPPVSILKNQPPPGGRNPAPVMKNPAPSAPGAEYGGGRRNSGGNLDYGNPAELETMDFVRRPPRPRK